MHGKKFISSVYSLFVSGCDFCCFSLKKKDWRMLDGAHFFLFLLLHVCVCGLCFGLCFLVSCCCFFLPIKFVII